MADHRMSVISSPAQERSFVSRWPAGMGRCTEDAYLCGRCGTILARTVAGYAPHHQIYHCYVCGALNAVQELALLVLPGATASTRGTEDDGAAAQDHFSVPGQGEPREMV